MQIGFHAGAWGSDHLFQALNEIRSTGLGSVEVFSDVATVYDGRAGEFKFFLQKAGLGLVAAYGGGIFTDVAFREADVEGAREMARWLAQAGGRILVLQGGESSGNADTDVHVAAATANLIGWACNAEGIEFCYQPHVGTVLLDELRLERFLGVANPELVGLCLDTGHLGEAGFDLVPFALQYAARVRIVHLRDLRRKPVFVGGPFTNPGKGTLPLVDVVAALRTQGYDGPVVGFADDPSEPPVKTARKFGEFVRTQLRLEL